MTQLPLRPNVCMMLINSEQKIFLGERKGERGHWQFPQGGVDGHGSMEQAVLRELEEEVGAPQHFYKIIKQLDTICEYEFKNAPSYFQGKWRGQRQTLWLVEFTGTDAHITLTDPSGLVPPEFSSWRWATVAEVLQYAAPIRLSSYRPALEEFEAWMRS